MLLLLEVLAVYAHGTTTQCVSSENSTTYNEMVSLISLSQERLTPRAAACIAIPTEGRRTKRDSHQVVRNRAR